MSIGVGPLGGILMGAVATPDVAATPATVSVPAVPVALAVTVNGAMPNELVIATS